MLNISNTLDVNTSYCYNTKIETAYNVYINFRSSQHVFICIIIRISDQIMVNEQYVFIIRISDPVMFDWGGGYSELDRSGRLCDKCYTGAVEDEQHFLIKCSKLNEYINSLFQIVSSNKSRKFSNILLVVD